MLISALPSRGVVAVVATTLVAVLPAGHDPPARYDPLTGHDLAHDPVTVGERSCIGLDRPVPGPVVRPYAPTGDYSGHWGVDLAADPGSVVRAAAAGWVSFAGSVAGRRSVTVDHGGGLRTSYSYLAAIGVAVGARVRTGDPVGRSGLDHGSAVVHLSVRVDGVYVDPVWWLRCHPPGGGLWLAPRDDPVPYPRRGATRHPRWDLRSATHGASPRRGDRVP